MYIYIHTYVRVYIYIYIYEWTHASTDTGSLFGDISGIALHSIDDGTNIYLPFTKRLLVETTGSRVEH